MKLGPWRFRTQKATATASQFVPALDRVREMREHASWEPVTSPENIQERAERVKVAREHITIPPLMHQRQERGRGASGPDILDLVRLALITMAIFLAIVVGLIFFFKDL